MTNSIPVIFESNLTKFTMRFECLTTFAQRSMRPFFEFLASNPSLKELGLSFSCYFPMLLQTPPTSAQLHRDTLPRVEYAEFEWVPQRAAILAMFASISLPNLTTLNVDATFEGGKTTSDYWDEDDDISVEDDGIEVGDMLVDMLRSQCFAPRLTLLSPHRRVRAHASIAVLAQGHARYAATSAPADRHDLDLEPAHCAYPGTLKLLTLELNNCEIVLVEWLEDFVCWLQRTDDGAWERFRMITVRACSELPKASC